MKLIAEIFSQGEELVSGQTVDTNAAWLSQQLTELGFRVTRHNAVGDNLQALVELIQEIARRADCCICTGGLGPTHDDLTAEAASLATQRPLVLDAEALHQIQAYFTHRHRPMPKANRKQAYFPEYALRLDNEVGTAPGFVMRYERCWFVFLPGVPVEMEAMFLNKVRDGLLQQFQLQPDCLVTLRSIGIGESAIQQALADLQLDEAVELGFRVTSDDVQTKLLFPPTYPIEQKQALVANVAALIGDFVYAIDGLDAVQGDLLEVIDARMQASAMSLAVLETLTQGLIAAKCIGRTWLQHAEIRLVPVGQAAINPEILPHTANLMATELRQQANTDLAVVQLYSGSAEDLIGKQKTIVLYNALYTADGVFSSQQVLAGSHKQKQNRAAMLALDLLRRYLYKKCL